MHFKLNYIAADLDTFYQVDCEIYLMFYVYLSVIIRFFSLIFFVNDVFGQCHDTSSLLSILVINFLS